MEKKGIEEIKAALVVIIDISLKLKEALKDNKISFWEGLSLSSSFKGLTDIAIGFEEIKSEYKDLSEAELLELESFVVSEYKIKGSTRQLINTAFDLIDLLLSLVDVVKTLKIGNDANSKK